MSADVLKARSGIEELAAEIERSETYVRNIIRALNLRKDKQGRYQTAPILEAHREKRARTKREAVGDQPLTWADRLKAKQVEKLDVQIAALRGTMVPIETVQADTEELCSIVNSGLDQWVSWVAARYQDAAAVEKAGELRDRLRTWLSEKCGEAGSTVKAGNNAEDE